ncbi:toxin-activating lysine-acyltransferase [Pacificimonas sp. WHA3]|uniref:RTX toxin-activating lysine-acyltransferase n=1 Tax=Pacificimonas pallii TaxID=2827236 RepID=A0ABS6SG73_9SPHN|nr:toxin-activating lysine-acyltransferase [Pacificimonas pallii]MBV7257404.1 toxin-activating lysine-acyltransferase [Pacificimonas pallii]
MKNEKPAASGVTISHLFGEMTWLMSQSPLHRALPIFQLEMLVMAPIMLRQLYIFRDGDKPVGYATWAYCNAAAEAKLEKGLLAPGAAFAADDWKSGDTCWLVDLVAPFANAQNQQREIMIADLISGPLKGIEIKLQHLDPKTGARKTQTIAPDAGEQLKAKLEEAASKIN